MKLIVYLSKPTPEGASRFTLSNLTVIEDGKEYIRVYSITGATRKFEKSDISYTELIMKDDNA